MFKKPGIESGCLLYRAMLDGSVGKTVENQPAVGYTGAVDLWKSGTRTTDPTGSAVERTVSRETRPGEDAPMAYVWNTGARGETIFVRVSFMRIHTRGNQAM